LEEVGEKFEIEPGETDEVTCDCFLAGDVETLEVYCYFENAKKRGPIGWGLTRLYDLTPTTPEPVERTVERLTGGERRT